MSIVSLYIKEIIINSCCIWILYSTVKWLCKSKMLTLHKSLKPICWMNQKQNYTHIFLSILLIRQIASCWYVVLEILMTTSQLLFPSLSYFNVKNYVCILSKVRVFLLFSSGQMFVVYFIYNALTNSLIYQVFWTSLCESHVLC